MAHLKIQGKVHTRSTNNEYNMEFIIKEEIVGKDGTIFTNYLPIQVKKKQNSDYSVRLQNAVSDLNVGDEVEITIEPKGTLGKDNYAGRCFSNLLLTYITVVNKTQKTAPKEEIVQDDEIPF